ncbi:MAG TPA: tRNA-intron lyase [Candidatus Nanoarchaeia archaeon]|nr:tRNA-intron lyase [Candidatus Nanoarchaeia archaeon]
MSIQANLSKRTISSNSQEAYSLFEKSHFGERIEDKIQYSLSEALYLMNLKKLRLFSNNKEISKKNALKKLQKIDKRIELKYIVFKDLRNKGYIPKTALKFGADFRVYEKGTKPGIAHAKWLVFIDYESKRISWHEFSAKNRVAHSTKKHLLLAVIDDEGDVTYYEVKWMKP